MRTQKTVGSTVYNYIWADGKLVNQSWGNNNLHFYYEQDGAVISFDYNGEKFSYIKNLQDDIVGVIDASGNVVASYTYDTWGALLSSSGSMANINPLRYRGYYYDTDTGMYYQQSRYYDPSLKRFINADVYCDTGTGLLGTNMFAYCVNNAVNASDPTGQWKIPLKTIGKIILSFGLNPIAAVLIGIGIYKFKLFIAYKYAAFLAKLSLFGGLAVKAAVAIVGAIIGWKVLVPIATSFFDAILQRKKGIEISLKKTWFGMPYGIKVGVY